MFIKKGGAILLVLSMSACAVQKEYAKSWPGYQYDTHHQGAVKHGAEPPLQLLWSFKTQGRILYAPVASENHIYLGSRDGHLYALNPESGSEVWKQKMGAGGPYKSLWVSENQVSTAQYGLYYHIYAWDAQGNKKWQYKTGELAGNAPQVSGNATRLCFNEDPLPNSEEGKSRFSCSRMDGQILWSTPLKGLVSQLPTLGPKHLWISQNTPNELVSLELETGHKQWATSLDSAPVTTPLYDAKRQRIYLATENGYVYAFEKGGKLAWRYQFPKIQFETDMALNHGRLYLPAKDKRLYTFNLQSLEPDWTFFAPGLLTAPVVTDDYVYIGCSNRSLYVLDRDKGFVRWSYITKGAITAPPILYQNKVLVGSSDGTLYAFGPQEAKEKNTKKTKPNPLNVLF